MHCLKSARKSDHGQNQLSEVSQRWMSLGKITADPGSRAWKYERNFIKTQSKNVHKEEIKEKVREDIPSWYEFIDSLK